MRACLAPPALLFPFLSAALGSFSAPLRHLRLPWLFVCYFVLVLVAPVVVVVVDLARLRGACDGHWARRRTARAAQAALKTTTDAAAAALNADQVRLQALHFGDDVSEHGAELGVLHGLLDEGRVLRGAFEQRADLSRQNQKHAVVSASILELLERVREVYRSRELDRRGS